MKELQALVNARTEMFLASGEVEKKIDTYLDKCFDDAIRSSFSYGELSESIKNVIKEKMGISLDQIDIQSYNAVLEETLRQKMAKFSNEAATQMFQDVLESVFKEAPKEITMHDLAAKILDDLRGKNESSDDYGEYYHVSWEKDDSYDWYNFRISDSSGSYSSTEVHLHFSAFREEYYRLAINHEMDITNPTSLHGIDKYLFSLYAAKTKILEVDEFDVDDLDTRKLDAEY